MICYIEIFPIMDVLGNQIFQVDDLLLGYFRNKFFNEFPLKLVKNLCVMGR